MSIKLQMENASGYMVAKFTGEGKPEEALLSFEQIVEQCKNTNNHRLLIDCTEAKTEMTIVDMYEQGEGAKIFKRYGIKVAVVVPEQKLEPEKFAEMVARNRGVNACVFTDHQTAKEWLFKMTAWSPGADACVFSDHQAAV